MHASKFLNFLLHAGNVILNFWLQFCSTNRFAHHTLNKFKFWCPSKFSDPVSRLRGRVRIWLNQLVWQEEICNSRKATQRA